MNILYVLHKDPGISLGGVERHTADLAGIMSLSNLNIFMLFPSSSSMVITCFAKGKRVNMKAGGLFCDDLTIKNRKTEHIFASILEKYSIDAVHFQHLLGCPLSLVKVAKMRGVKVFVTIHDYFSGARAINSSARSERKVCSSAFFRMNAKYVPDVLDFSTIKQ